MTKEIVTYWDNDHNTHQVFRLPVGTKLRAIKTLRGLDDFGMSGLTFECTEFEKGKVYKVHATHYDGSTVISESNCLFMAKTELFEKVV
jgi:hypothetical protein